MKERHIWLITVALLILMIIIFPVANPLKKIINDPRYVLLVIVTLIGLCFTLISYFEFRKKSFVHNFFDAILGMFQFSNLFIFLLGLGLLLAGIYGLIHGPDSIGMQKL